MNAEIERLCGYLSLEEKEGPVRRLDVDLKNHGEQMMAFYLVGKVLSTKLIDRKTFMSQIGIKWRVKEEVVIEIMTGNIFLFTFKNANDKRHVLADGPWIFGKSLIVLEEPQGTGDISCMKFSRVEFWVQIHNVPLLCMNKEIGMFLGRMIGEVTDIDVGPSGYCMGKFLRLRIVIEIDKPLLRCLRVDLLGTGMVTMLLLRYERLPDYCFRCCCLGHTIMECLGHTIKECPKKVGDTGGEAANRLLSAWIRATSPINPFSVRDRKRDHRWNRSVDDGAGVSGLHSSCRTIVLGQHSENGMSGVQNPASVAGATGINGVDGVDKILGTGSHIGGGVTVGNGPNTSEPNLLQDSGALMECDPLAVTEKKINGVVRCLVPGLETGCGEKDNSEVEIGSGLDCAGAVLCEDGHAGLSQAQVGVLHKTLDGKCSGQQEAKKDGEPGSKVNCDQIEGLVKKKVVMKKVKRVWRRKIGHGNRPTGLSEGGDQTLIQLGKRGFVSQEVDGVQKKHISGPGISNVAVGGPSVISDSGSHDGLSQMEGSPEKKQDTPVELEGGSTWLASFGNPETTTELGGLKEEPKAELEGGSTGLASFGNPETTTQLGGLKEEQKAELEGGSTGLASFGNLETTTQLGGLKEERKE
ncbi:hypothetical protein Dsin_009927 [Dipteronia sinensis]|uniref:DUF4283 domain-containing protein n=1 Tax=Dipteronia sinensis TaxID=43782 RepID=A0AAE0ARS6_9ROSI|nr:hypothetical protein Dsin_009927 [Dipteronia sinensis]